jgi:hypothetical protein
MSAHLATRAIARKYLSLGCSCLLSLATGDKDFGVEVDAWMFGQRRSSARRHLESSHDAGYYFGFLG